MQQSFNYYEQAELPDVILCNPDKSPLYYLTPHVYDDVVTLRYNGLSEFSFKLPQKTNDEDPIEIPGYSLIQAKRLINLKGVGYFIVATVTEEMTGANPYKVIECRSLEAEFIGKKVTALSGTYKFHEPIPSSNTTIMEIVLGLVPSWSAGTIDATIAARYRTFNITDTTLYAFLMTDVEKAYQCVFDFDTINKQINVYDVTNITNNTGIYMSFDNLIEKANFKEISDEIVTAMRVYGGGGLSIRAVNPLGTNVIYNYDYYKTTDWMSQDLINAINAWELAIDNAMTIAPTYGDHLTDLKNKNQEILNLIYGSLSPLVIGLNQLNTELAVLEAEQQLEVTKVPPVPALIADVAARIVAKELEITNKETAITTAEAERDAIQDILDGINSTLSQENFFTPTQLVQLSLYTYENAYTNENLIATDIMTTVEIQEAAQNLYDQSVVVLGKAAQPRYEFSVDSVNFIALKEYEPFTQELELGCTIRVDISPNYKISTVLLEIKMSYTRPMEFNLTFSNRLRLDGANYQYSDLFSQMSSASSAVVGNGIEWSNFENNYKNEVSTFISSALNATVNNVISSSNQELTINGYGLRGRKKLIGGGYDEHEAWLTHNVLAFTNDNWDTASVALGKIEYNGANYYGLVADVIVGRLLAGNQFQFTNDDGVSGLTKTFTFDGNGAILRNSDFVLTTDKTRVAISPTEGIKIQKNEGVVDPFIVLEGGPTFPFTYTNAGTAFVHTQPIIVSAQENRLLFVAIGYRGLSTIVSVRAGGQSLSKYCASGTVGNYPNAEIWYKIAPMSGNYDLVVTTSANEYIQVSAGVFDGVDQSLPFGTESSTKWTSGAYTPATANVTGGTVENSLFIDVISYFGAVPTPYPGQTLRASPIQGSWGSGVSTRDGALNATMGWNDLTNFWALTTVYLKAAPFTPGGWTNVFYADANGDVFFSGNLSGATGTFSGDLSGATGVFSGEIFANAGTIGGWAINTTGIANSYGDHILTTPSGDVDVVLGGLTVTQVGSTDTFEFVGESITLESSAGIIIDSLTSATYIQGTSLEIDVDTINFGATTVITVNSQAGITGTIDTATTPNLVFDQGILVGYS